MSGSRNNAEVWVNSLGEEAAYYAVTRALDPGGSDTPLSSRASVETCHSVWGESISPFGSIKEWLTQ